MKSLYEQICHNFYQLLTLILRRELLNIDIYLYHFQANVPETCSRISLDTNEDASICTFSLQTLMNNLFKLVFSHSCNICCIHIS